MPDQPLEDIVPYVNGLKLVDDDLREPNQTDFSTSVAPIGSKDYSQCTKFSLKVRWFNVAYFFLEELLHRILEMEEYRTYHICVGEFKERQVESPLNLINPIGSGDSHKVVVAKVRYVISIIFRAT